MALVKCEECGKEISDTSKVCIHCGYKKKKTKRKNKLSSTTIYSLCFIGIIFLIICFIIVFVKIDDTKTRNKINKIVGTWNYSSVSSNGSISSTSISFAKNGKCKYEDTLYWNSKPIAPQDFECTWEGIENVGGWFNINIYLEGQIIFKFKYYNDFDELIRHNDNSNKEEKFKRENK